MIRNRPTAPAALLAAVFALGSLPATADFVENRTFDGDRLEIRGLIGSVDVRGHAGPRFEVRVNVRGRDASPETVRIRTEEGPDRLAVLFPLDRERDYVYPALGAGSRTSFSLDRDDGWLAAIFGGLFDRRIEVRGSGRGLEVWADVEVRVPAGARLDYYHGVGEMRAGSIEGDLRLDNHAGAIHVSGVRGNLVADTGSGSVEIEGVQGELLVDTGSGRVEVRDCSGPSVLVDTGSGSVRVERIDARKLDVDTGSGSVRALAVRADRARIDTGSGSVTLELDRMGTGEFLIDTGSGAIELRLPPDASAQIRAETSSGGIDVDLDGVAVVRRGDDEVELRLGSGASRVTLDSGSGGIRIGASR